MSIHNIPFSIYKRKSAEIISNLRLWDFSKGLKDEFETGTEVQLYFYKVCMSKAEFWESFLIVINSLTTEKQTTKFSSANFQKKLNPSCTILRIQRLEGKQCRS